MINRVKLLSGILKKGCDDIFKTLGFSHSESVYHKALSHWLNLHNIRHSNEHVINYYFKDHYIGYGRADIVINYQTVKYDEKPFKAIVEIKNLTKLTESEYDQLKKYMKFSQSDIGYLINFPKRSCTNTNSKVTIETIYNK